MISKRYAVVGMVAALILGIVLGSLLAVRPVGQSPGGGPLKVQAVERSAAEDAAHADLEAALAKDPKNGKLWLAIGNSFYDRREPEKAIDAYEMALRLGERTADLLTDLGSMYRSTRQFERAVLAFQEAKTLDPKHIPSRLNEGIVLFYDLSQVEPAVEVWEEALAINPKIKLNTGEPLSELVRQLKNRKQ
ncbi:MAG: tetratricopeptide repeat protein [Desulfovibrionaceae bacterium]|nr:tetratricopeptide repeat protein [Desulfovibrionaceae bacterium]